MPHNEVILAASPSDPERLLAGSMLRYETSNNQCAGYLSIDGGRSWKPVLEPGRSEPRLADYAADPAVAFGTDGSAYFALLISDGKGGPSQSVVLRSTDGGLTWDEPAHVNPATTTDRPFVAVDRTGGPHDGRIYCYAAVRNPMLGDGGDQLGIGIFFSKDRGRTFSEPVLQRVRMESRPKRASVPNRQLGVGNGNCVILSDGTVVALYSLRFEDSQRPPDYKQLIAVERSIDGGRSFEPYRPSPRPRAPGERRIWDRHIDEKKLADSQESDNGIPCIAVDPSKGPYRDRTYAAWSIYEGGMAQVILSVSADKGQRWSEPVAVSDGADPGPFGDARGAFMPAVAVSKDGVVGVSWYVIREAAGKDRTWDARFTSSLDGGKTWLPSVRVSEVSSLKKRDRPDAPEDGRGMSGLGLGDTAGLAADANGAFHALWIDNRTGIRQAWTAAISVGGEP